MLLIIFQNKRYQLQISEAISKTFSEGIMEKSWKWTFQIRQKWPPHTENPESKLNKFFEIQ